MVGHQNVRVFYDGFHALRIRDKVRADITAVEIHPLDELGLRFNALAFFHCDHTVAAHFFHHIGQHLADLRVVGRDSGDLGHVGPAFNGD